MNEKGSEVKSFSVERIARHLAILGDRETYAVFGGKPEWSEKAGKYIIPKDSPNKKTEWITRDAIPKVIEEYTAKGWTIWISLNDKETGKDTIEGVTDIYCFWFDFDPARANKAKPATDEERAKTLDDAVNFKAGMQRNFGVVGFMACSGNGHHLFYPIAPFKLIGTTFRKEFNEKQRQFYKKLREASNAPFDSTADIRRVTQPIGNPNVKIPGEPVKTYWIDQPTDEEIRNAREKNITLLETILNTKAEPQKEEKEYIAVHPGVDDVLKHDTKLKELYAGNWQQYGFKSRSEAEQSFVTILCMNEFSDHEISGIMNGCKIGKWQETGESYHTSTLKAGREFAAEHQKKEKKHHRAKNVFRRDDEGRRRVNWDVLLDNLAAEYTFKTLDDTKQVLVYDNGIYRAGNTVIEEYVEDALEDEADSYHIREIIGHVQRSTFIARSRFNTDTGYVPVLNGLLNLSTLELEAFDANKFYTYRLPVEYNPNAGYSHIEEFFNQVLESADIPAMQEVFGYCMYPGYPAHKMFWWLGRGRNGKTTTGNLLTALVGVENTAGVPLNQLDGDHRFAVARLFGKLVNVVAEPETKSVMQTPTLKSAVGGDLIFGEKKGVQDAFPFVNFAKFTIYANRVPEIPDSSLAFWDRVIVFNYPHEFRGAKAKKNHHQTIIEEDGLSGLLNWALVGLKRLKNNNWEFTKTRSQNIAKLSMKRLSQPVASFVEEWTKFSNSGYIPKDALFDAYKIYCDVHGIIIPDEGTFTRDLKRNARVKQIRARSGKNRIPAWQGIRIKDAVEVVISAEKKEEEAETEKEDSGKDKDKIEVCKLSEFLLGQGGQGGHTFSYSSILGEKTVITENKDIFTIYKRSWNTPAHNDHRDQKKLEGLEGEPEKDTTAPKEKAVEKGLTGSFVCICGKRFDTVEVLRHHQANCKEFQTQQDKEAREQINENAAEVIKNDQ